MTFAATRAPISGVLYSTESYRLGLQGILGGVSGSFAGGVTATDPAHGIVRTSDLAVAQTGTPSMGVQIATGACFVRGTWSASQGTYYGWNDATVTPLAIAAAHATNGRRDIVGVVVKDHNYDGTLTSLDDGIFLAVVTGTPSGSPVDPTLPANFLPLARVTVAALASSIVNANITDLRSQVRSSYNVARGRKGLLYLTKTSSQSTSTSADLTSMSGTLTPEVGRKYEIVGQFPRVQITTSGGEAGVSINVAGTNVQQAYCAGSTNDIFPMYLTAEYDAVSATPVTVKLSMGVVTAGGMTASASATAPIVLSIRDIGPT